MEEKKKVLRVLASDYVEKSKFILCVLYLLKKAVI